MMPRLLSFLLILTLGLAACAPRGRMVLDPEAAGVGSVQRVFVGTTRIGDTTEGWSFRRNFEPLYARFDVSIPPDRELGSVPWPPKRGTPDPQKHMVTVDAALYAKDGDFRKALAAELGRTKRGTREAVVFIHGFNNTFAEGLYRFAQLNHDLDLPGAAVHYAWPSRGSVLGYAYDRDSVMFARDGLEQLLNEVAESGADRIVIVGHSMGSHLTMEALRQIAIRKNRKVMDRIAGVVLMSPDIDLDVFRSQANGIGKLPQPFVIFTSKQDRALSLSAVIAGESARLGNVSDVAELAGLEVTLLDTGAYSTGDGHFNAARSPALIQLLSKVTDINSALVDDAKSRVGLLPGAVLTVQGATQVILSPVEGLLMD